MLESKKSIASYPAIIAEAKLLELGVLLYLPHPRAMLGQQQRINVWISPPASDWKINDGIGNVDLAMLTAYKFRQNWQAEIHLITVVKKKEDQKKAQKYLKELIELSRLSMYQADVKVGNFEEEIEKAAHADLNIFGISENIDLQNNQKWMEKVNTSCLFVMDSGNENVLA